MSFSDPQTVTINSIPFTCNKISSDGMKSVYATTDEGLKLTISHQESKGRTRRMARLDQRVVATDPLTSVNEYKTLGVYVVIDEPEYGFDDDDIDDVVQGFTTWLDSTCVGKILGNQS